MRDIFLALYARDLRLAMRRPIEALLPVGFFVVAVTLFPLGVGPEREALRQIATGVVWVCALLASMLSMNAMYASDYADGSLEQLLLSGHGGLVIALAKVAANWTVSALPVVACAPLFALLFDMSGASLATLTLALLLGTPVFSLLGSVAAALTLGLRSSGVLISLLVLPLSIPALVFGTGAVVAVDGGQSPGAHFSVLGALLIFTTLLAPLASAAALRIALE